ncbi:hypothetical protein DND58_31180, partial [Pseudomonas syringae pv. pisi]
GAWVKGGGVKSPTGLYCANSQKRTKSLLLPSSLTIQANLFAKNTHALRQKQTVIPSFWPQAVANLFAKNTLTPYGRSKP